MMMMMMMIITLKLKIPRLFSYLTILNVGYSYKVQGKKEILFNEILIAFYLWRWSYRGPLR